jgi:hypothetical protein
MRNVARIKLGYYPLPTDEGSRLRQPLNYPSDSVSVLDPCAGTGAALLRITAKVESFSLLYLNPPYDSEVSSFGNKRMEFLFLQRTFRWLVNGGVLLMVVPHE